MTSRAASPAPTPVPGAGPRRGNGRFRPVRMMFVCTANISRSPYAERRARQVMEASGVGGIEFSSSGVPGVPGRPMDPEMALLLEARGVDPSGHVSRQVSERLMTAADLVIVFEFAQHMRLLDLHPDHAMVVLGLGQAVRTVQELTVVPAEDAEDRAEQLVAAAGPNSIGLDVDDPYQRGARVARDCADEIDASLAVLLPFLAGRELSWPDSPPPSPATGTQERIKAERPRLRWPWSR